jgi:hypothetical protein
LSEKTFTKQTKTIFQSKTLAKGCNWELFSQERAHHQNEVCGKREEYENNNCFDLANKAETNTNKWWTLLKNSYRNNDVIDTIPPLEISDQIISGDYENPTAFDKFFLSISIVDESYLIMKYSTMWC